MTKRLIRYTRKNKARKSRRNTHRRKLRHKKRNYTKRKFFIKRGGGGCGCGGGGGGEVNPYKLYAQTTFNDSSQYNAGSAANHVMTMVGDGPTQKHFSFISAYN